MGKSMSKAYYVCKIIGDGQSPETAFRPAIQDVIDPKTHLKAFNTSHVIAINPATGQPVKPWCLVIAAGPDHSLVRNHPDIDAMPDYGLDVKISSMHTPTKNGMTAKLNARGIDTSALGNADGYRDLIRGLGRQHDAAFDEKAFDVSE